MGFHGGTTPQAQAATHTTKAHSAAYYGKKGRKEHCERAISDSVTVEEWTGGFLQSVCAAW